MFGTFSVVGGWLVLLCPKRVFLVLEFVQLRVKNAVESLLFFVSDFAEECR